MANQKKVVYIFIVITLIYLYKYVKKNMVYHNEIPVTHNNDNVTFPEIPITSKSWVPVIPNHSYVYSAFIDNRENISGIKLIVILNETNNRNSNLKCLLWNREGKQIITVNSSVVTKIGKKRR